MKKYIKNKRVLVYFKALVGLPFVLSLVFANFSGLYLFNTANAQTGSASFNNSQQDLPTLQVSNYTLNPGCSTCWLQSLSNVHNGDVVSFEIYYHNTSNVTAQNTRMSISLSNSGSQTTATARLWADNASPVFGSASVSPAAGLGSMTLTFQSAVWGPNQTISGSEPLPNGQTGAEVTSPNGVNIGNVAPGWQTQGNLVVRFTVSATGGGGGSAPTVQTSPATSIGQNSATLNASVNPNGSATNYWFEYGTTQSFGQNAASQSLAAGNSSQNVSFSITNLSPNTTYYFRVSAQNSVGTSFGNTMSFSTLQGGGGQDHAPVVVTDIATNITSNSATLNGSVNPNGALTNYWFTYGIGSNLNQNTASQSLPSDSQNHSVTFNLLSLSPNTTYSFQLVAQNQYGTTNGSVMTFTTTSSGGGGGNAPVVQTNTATNVTQNGAALNASVNPNGLLTNYWFVYGQNSNLNQNTASQSLSGGTQSQNVSFQVFNLTANTTYSFQAVAQNSAGTSYGNVLTFNTSYGGGGGQGNTPIVQTFYPTNFANNSANLSGSVNPNNSQTNYWFEYGNSPSFGLTTPSQSVGSFSYAQNVSYNVYGLIANATYYVRLDAQNSYGTVYGNTVTFTTSGGSSGPTLTIVPSSANITGNQTQYFTAWYYPNGTGYYGYYGYQSGQDVTQMAIWSTSNSSIAQQVGPGQFRGNGNGSVTVSANYASLYDNALLTVSGAFGNSPYVQTNSATNILNGSVVLNGTVNSSGVDTYVYFQYGTDSNNLTYTTNQLFQSSVSYSSNFSQTIYNLSNQTTYYFRAVAQNTYGTYYGQTLSLTTGSGYGYTSGQAPMVTTLLADPVYRNSAVLNGNINPNGGLTTAWFEYGATRSLGSQTPPQSMGSGTSFTLLTYPAYNLTSNTTYYFRAAAQNQYGSTYGSIISLTTQAAAVVSTPAVTAAPTPATPASCAILVPSFTPGTPLPAQAFEYDLTYRNDCGFRLKNATLRFIFPKSEFDFGTVSKLNYTQEDYGLQYVLGDVQAGYEETIVVKGGVKDTAVSGDALVFGAMLDFTDQNGRFRSVSAFVSPVIGPVTATSTPLAASLFSTLGSLFGSWLFLLLLLIIIALLIYWIFFKEKEKEVGTEAVV